jgi:uncharacterized membrane protein HdeD (DUF308 family)
VGQTPWFARDALIPLFDNDEAGRRGRGPRTGGPPHCANVRYRTSRALTRCYDCGRALNALGVDRRAIREVHLIQRLSKNWWLLALAGVFDAMLSAMTLFIERPDGSLTLRTTVRYGGTLEQMGMLALAAGVCTIAAGIRSHREGRSWLLVLNGLSCGALGLIFTFRATGPIAFRTIALLIVAMAIGVGIYELTTAQSLRPHAMAKWFLGTAAAVSIAFVLVFLALAFRQSNVERNPLTDFLWLGSYYGFSAICKLGLALGVHSAGLSQSGRWEQLPPLGSPKHAH